MSSYHSDSYAFLSIEQKRVIAHFLDALPRLVELDREDETRVERAIAAYWNDFLS